MNQLGGFCTWGLWYFPVFQNNVILFLYFKMTQRFNEDRSLCSVWVDMAHASCEELSNNIMWLKIQLVLPKVVFHSFETPDPQAFYCTSKQPGMSLACGAATPRKIPNKIKRFLSFQVTVYHTVQEVVQSWTKVSADHKPAFSGITPASLTICRE